MKIVYSRYFERAETRAERMEGLISLFGHILMQTGGDVDEAFRWMEQIDGTYGIFPEDLTMQEFVEELKRRGLIERGSDGRLEPTSKAVQRIRRDALQDVFGALKKSPDGAHDVPHTGSGVDRVSETRAYAFGDAPSNIDLTATMKNAFARHGIEDFSLVEEDVEVYETEHLSSAATVLMLDVSHSMILYGEDRITPAKNVALALSELIMTRYPKDRFHVLLFGDDATEISVHDLPFVTVGPYHTNTREGLRLARSILRRSGNANKQIFMVTDGKPSAMFEEDGRLYKNSYGLDPRIVNKTLDEAVACRRERIVISTFMVAQDQWLIDFVEELTQANQGRAYYTGLGQLGEFVLVDYIRNRRRKIR